MSANHSRPRLRIVFAGALALSSTSLPATAQHATPSDQPIGDVEFPISCSAPAQARFERGLALLHHMMYEQAEQTFTGITREEAGCAMPHWGIAMTLFHPLWVGQPAAQELDRGRAAVERAKAQNPPTERERAYIRAAEAFYAGSPSRKHGERLAAWAAAQAQVYRDFPDDIDAGALYALSQLATAPKDDTTFARQREVGELLEQLHARAPRHPGGFHYLIHAYDNPVLAERAVHVARGYDQLAPDVPHALHMPAHIFVRLGLWPDVIAWNQRSARAALHQPVAGTTSLHYAHAVDYLIYAHLQRGEDETARAVLAELNLVDNHQDNLVSAYGVAAAQARYALERQRWDEAIALAVRTPSNFSWDNYAAVEAITHFARGVGGARGGDLKSARDAITQLERLHARLRDAKQGYWAVLVESQGMTVDAWIRHAQGQQQEALARMRQAADLEDSVDKHPVTPGAVLPARELLGDMLALSGRIDEAIAAYQAALVISPKRFRSLYGSFWAATLAGNRPHEVSRFREELLALVAGSNSDRKEVKQIRQALAAKTSAAAQ